MEELTSVGGQIAERRKALGISQAALAVRSGISRATLDALENGRAREIGFSRLTKVLTALGLELKLQAPGRERPTLDELLEENRDDQGLDRRR